MEINESFYTKGTDENTDIRIFSSIRSNESILEKDYKIKSRENHFNKVVNIFENKLQRYKMNMNTYKVELNKEFVNTNKFFNKNLEELREIKKYLDMLFEDEKKD
jgi:hypothetical protein